RLLSGLPADDAERREGARAATSEERVPDDERRVGAGRHDEHGRDRCERADLVAHRRTPLRHDAKIANVRTLAPPVVAPRRGEPPDALLEILAGLEQLDPD